MFVLRMKRRIGIGLAVWGEVLLGLVQGELGGGGPELDELRG